MKHTLINSLLVSALLLSPAWAAVDIKGVKFSETYEVASQPLKLNGAGLRVKVVFNIYAASLYLPQKQTTAQGVISAPGAKSVQAVMLRDLTADEFVSAMIKGFKANNSAADVARLMPRLEALETMMTAVGKAPKGTSVHIDYLPGIGTRIIVDGQRRGADIPGEDFYQAMLRIWLGDDPVDSDLKTSLLGGK